MPELIKSVREELERPAPRPSGRKVGAVTHKADAGLLPMLGLFCQVAEREKGLKPHAAIRWLVAKIREGGALGASDDAVTRRLYQKMRAGKFDKVELPPSIDQSRFTLKSISDVD